MNDLLFEYWEAFGEKPPLLKMTTYNNKIYQDLMKKALKRGRPISKIEFDLLASELKYDVVEPTQNEVREANLKSYLK